MNREIKFRAWDKWNNKMIQPHDGDFIRWHSMSNWRDCLDVMQYTGLKDKNDNEIYEGDIIKIYDWGPAANKILGVTSVVWDIDDQETQQ